jgi:hypothetical protein
VVQQVSTTAAAELSGLDGLVDAAKAALASAERSAGGTREQIKDEIREVRMEISSAEAENSSLAGQLEQRDEAQAERIRKMEKVMILPHKVAF